MDNTIILLAFSAMLAWGLSDFLIQKMVRNIGNRETMAWLGIISSIALLPFAFKDLSLLLIPRNLFFLTMLGVSTFVMNYFALEAFKTGKLSVMEVVHTIELPLTIFFGIFVLKEFVSWFQAMIIMFMFLGIYLISKREATIWDKIKLFFTGTANLWEKGVMLGAAGGIICSLVNLMIAYGSKTLTPILVIWFPWLIFAILSFLRIIFGGKLKNFIHNSGQMKKVIITAGLIDALAWAFYAFVLSKNSLSITTAITDSYPAIAMFLGIRFNGEKISSAQYAGAFVALSASIILGLTS